MMSIVGNAGLGALTISKPFFAAIQLLKEYMASEIGVGDGEIIASSKGLHLYDYSWDLARAVVNR